MQDGYIVGTIFSESHGCGKVLVIGIFAAGSGNNYDGCIGASSEGDDALVDALAL